MANPTIEIRQSSFGWSMHDSLTNKLPPQRAQQANASTPHGQMKKVDFRMA